MRSPNARIIAGLLCLAGCLSIAARDGYAQDFKLDLGAFVPEARGIVIELNRGPNGAGRLRVDVPQRGLHFDTNDLSALSADQFPFLALPPAEGQPPQPGGASDALEPQIDLGDPQTELGEPQATAPAAGAATQAFDQPAPAPSVESDIELGEPASEPAPRIIPDPPEPGALPAPADSEDPPATPGRSGYMGILAEPVPETIAAHLEHLLPNRAGLLVTRVVPDSPASAAGLRLNDILVRYDETPLSSFEQLTGLVRDDQAGAKIPLQIIRTGRVSDLEIELGAAPLPPAEAPTALPGQAMDLRGFLEPGGGNVSIPPNNVDMSAVGAQLLDKVGRLFTTYRLVGVDYETLPGRQYRGVVTLADASGRIFELPAAGTESEVQLQLLEQLFKLP